MTDIREQIDAANDVVDAEFYYGQKGYDVSGETLKRALGTMEKMLAVVEAARICKRVGFSGIQVSTQKASGDLLMEALAALDSDGD